MWRTLDTGRAGAVGVGVTIAPQGSINRHARARHVPATESGLCGGQLVRLARRQPPRRHGQPRRRAQRNDDQSDILPNLRSVPFERAAHGPMTQRHARDTERAARNEAAGRAAMATGASGRSVRLATAVTPREIGGTAPSWRPSLRLQHDSTRTTSHGGRREQDEADGASRWSCFLRTLPHLQGCTTCVARCERGASLQ